MNKFGQFFFTFILGFTLSTVFTTYIDSTRIKRTVRIIRTVREYNTISVDYIQKGEHKHLVNITSGQLDSLRYE